MNNSTHLRIGGVPEHFNLPWHLAIEADAFSACSVVVEWVSYSTGTGAMLKDLEAGQLDLAVLLTEGAALGLARELPIEAVSLYTSSPLIWGVHVSAASHYRSIADLERARFGISRYGSGSHLMSLALAMEQGWDASRLEFVVVDDLPGAINAFAAGRAEVFLWEHFTTQPAVDDGHFRRVDDFVSPWPAWVLCARKDVLAESRAQIEAMFDRVCRQAQSLAADDDAAAIIARRFGLEQAAVEQWLERTQWVSGCTPPADALAAAERMLREAGAI